MKEILVFAFTMVTMAWGIHMIDLGLRKTAGFMQFLMFFIAAGLILSAVQIVVKQTIVDAIQLTVKQAIGG